MSNTPEYNTATIDIKNISILGRIRKELGGIDELAEDIGTRGLINPITVMNNNENTYTLIAGLRRLEACKKLGMATIRASILSPLAADEVLSMEYAENVHRKDFTVTERIEYADKIKFIEQAKARDRKSLYARSGYNEKKQDVPNWAHPEIGKTRDTVAKRAGFTSHTQYERAAVVAKKRPDLLEKIDLGEMSISGAYLEAKKECINENQGLKDALIFNKEERDLITIITTPNKKYDPLSDFNQKTQSNTLEISAHENKQNHIDEVSRARHDRLMRNTLYSELYTRCDQLSREINIVKVQSNIRAEGYEKRIRCYEDNVAALQKQCDALEKENNELRKRYCQTTEGVSI